MVVCLIDDDKIFRFTTEKYLHFIPEVETFHAFKNVADALNFCKENKSDPGILADLLLLDINIPGSGGWGFMKEYSKIKGTLAKHPLIYMVSSSIDARDAELAAEHSDIEDYIIKPLDETRIIEIIKKIKQTDGY